MCEGPPATLERCGPGGLYFPDEQKCFYYESDRQSWSEARADCQARGSGWDLASIDSAAQDAFVYSSFALSRDAWLGMSDTASEGNFVWANGAAFSYENWNGSSPGSDDCGAMRDENGRWQTRSCSDDRPSVCSAPSVGAQARVWDEQCVSLVGELCGVACEDPARGVGLCQPWFPGNTDEHCAGVDLGVGLPCDGVVPVCNHGQSEAPAGIQIAHFPEDSGEFATCSPDLSGPDVGLCVTTEPIPAGECIDVTGCTGLTPGREVMVNPVDGSEMDECHCGNNWSVYDSIACGAPSCSGDSSQGTLKPVNMFITWDKSGSMGGSKWTASTSALNAFFADSGSTGIGAALKFYPNGACGDACDESACAIPDVPLGRLTADPSPIDTQEAALVSAVSSTSPGGSTPTYAALAGATRWAVDGITADPNSAWVVVLVTDGEPTRCNTNDSAIAGLAGTALGEGVRTYVIGLEGSNESALDQIAAQGGTDSAFFIAGTNENAVETQIIAALQSIAGDSVSCELELPNPGRFDPERATVEYVPGEGPPEPVAGGGATFSCASGQTLYRGHCYELETSNRRWTSARDACENIGAGWSLASSDSPQENAFLNGMGLHHDTWIAGNDRSSEGTWQWENGSCWSWEDFNNSNSSGSDCISLRDESSADWRIRDCGDSRDSLCEGPAYHQGVCDAGEAEGPGGRCYFASSAIANFDAAEAACQARGSGWHLAAASSVTENDLIGAMLDCAPAWIGLSDADGEGDFVWTDGTALGYQNWGSGQPNGPDCAQIGFDGSWEDADCGVALPYVCRGPDPSASTPSDPADDGPTPLDNVGDAAACGDGWYYDDAGAPTTMTLCPDTCSVLQADLGARLQVSIGCPDSGGGFQQTTRSETYEAACDADTHPQWGFLSYATQTPGDSNVVFRARVADAADDLGAALPVDLATASFSTGTETCAMSGPFPCPIDLYAGLGGSPESHRRFLELEIELNPGSASEQPVLQNWEVTFSCLPNQ